MAAPSLSEMFDRLLRRPEQGRAAWTVEVFGWLVLGEGLLLLFAPRRVEALLHLPPFGGDGPDWLRLIGVLASGVGMLYAVSGRLNAQGFVFASLLDRPLVPPIMVVLWYLGVVPPSLALVFSVQDFAGFLWTLQAWRAQARAAA